MDLVSTAVEILVRIRRAEHVADGHEIGGTRDVRVPRGKAGGRRPLRAGSRYPRNRVQGSGDQNDADQERGGEYQQGRRPPTWAARIVCPRARHRAAHDSTRISAGRLHLPYSEHDSLHLQCALEVAWPRRTIT